MEPEFERADLLTPKQVAALLFVHPKTVTRWARSGQLSFVRTPGGHRRYLASEVAAIVAARPVLTPRQPTARIELSSADVDDAEDPQADAPPARTAATVVASAAERERAARQHAAEMAAQAVAREAVRTARRVQIRAQSAVAKVADAADQAAEELVDAGTPGNERQAAHVANLLAAITQAAAHATAQETERAAATVARDVEAAAAHIARLVAAADEMFVNRVSDTVAALESVAQRDGSCPA